MKKLRAIAFVLPQFHPIPENDKWWGKGFTEWTNVKKAKPLFQGHYQPQIPTELGYYDLRDSDARSKQAKLAKSHGVYGFCYYHYWFNGKRLLDIPIDEMLRTGEPDMPFMLCWANENWTRTWDGLEKDILIKQEYSFEDDRAHIRWLCKNIFSDSRYIKVDDRPVFIIYRQALFPDIKKTLKIWREIAQNEFGLRGLYLCSTESFQDETPPEDLGFDAVIEFSPHQVISKKAKVKKNKLSTIINKLVKNSQLDLRDFGLGVEHILNRKIPDYKLFRSITPGWDNTPRKGSKGIIALGSSPELYYHWFSQVCAKFQPYTKDENFIFLNALNEWAEGNHLEPCSKYGKSYLDMTKKVLEKY